MPKTANSRNNLKWTAAEDKRLEELYNKEKYTFKAIATDLHRSLDAIQARYVKQVLCSKYSPKYLLENKEALAKHHNIETNDLVRYLKYAGIKEIAKSAKNTRKNRNKRVQYELEIYDVDDDCSSYDSNDSNDSDDSDDSDVSWQPSDNDDTSSDSDDASYLSDDEEEQHYIHNYILQKQKERKEIQEKLTNIMKYLEMLNEKIDKLDKKYK
jgi:hypothetical protein